MFQDVFPNVTALEEAIVLGSELVPDMMADMMDNYMDPTQVMNE